MKVILTCGYPSPLPTKVHDILVAARLIRLTGSEHETLQLETLQAKVLEDAGLSLNGPFTDWQLTPGKEYRELANSILRTDSGDPAFGWTSSRTLWLADFWAGIDEQILFIFVYSRPEAALAELLKGTEVGEQEFDKALSNWTEYYTEVFRCYFQNPGRSLLIHADTILEPSMFLGKVAQFLALNGADISLTLPRAESEKSAINEVLIRAAIAARGLRLDLYDELESAADIPGTTSSVHEWKLCERARNEYSSLLLREAEASAQRRADQIRLEDLSSLGPKLNAELLELRRQASTWQQRAGDLQAEEAALTSELREQRNQAGAWKQRADDLQAVEATLTSELREQRDQTATWKQRIDDLQSVEAALTAELREQRVQTDYWKQLADEFEALGRDRGVRLKLLESDVLNLSNKLSEDEKCAAILSAESARLRAEDLELRKECALATQQWLKAEEELDRLKLQVKDVNDAATASLAAKDEELEQCRHERLAMENDNAVAAGEIAHLRRELESAATSSSAKEEEMQHWRHKRRQMENDSAIATAEIAHLQRELESALSQLASLPANRIQETSGPASEIAVHTSEISCDFREHIDGENWYDAEHDGRWAGPRNVSALRLPRLGPGEYQFEIEVVDAMDPQFLVKMEVLLNGKPMEFTGARSGRRYPVLLKGQFSTSTVPERGFWEFQFAFPGLVSPSTNGSDDERLLAIRVKTLKVALLDKPV